MKRRIKLLKDYDNYKKGEVVTLSKKEAFWVVETGRGIYTKDMMAKDMVIK